MFNCHPPHPQTTQEERERSAALAPYRVAAPKRGEWGKECLPPSELASAPNMLWVHCRMDDTRHCCPCSATSTSAPHTTPAYPSGVELQASSATRATRSSCASRLCWRRANLRGECERALHRTPLHCPITRGCCLLANPQEAWAGSAGSCGAAPLWRLANCAPECDTYTPCPCAALWAEYPASPLIPCPRRVLSFFPPCAAGRCWSLASADWRRTTSLL